MPAVRPPYIWGLLAMNLPYITVETFYRQIHYQREMSQNRYTPRKNVVSIGYTMYNAIIAVMQK
jgi:hypothetical protein